MTNFKDYALDQPIPEQPLDPSSALGSGYSEAKWVAERILCNAAEQHHVPISIVRLGQVCGDRSGYWNEKEWFPAVIKSALSTRCLPSLEVHLPPTLHPYSLTTSSASHTGRCVIRSELPLGACLCRNAQLAFSHPSPLAPSPRPVVYPYSPYRRSTRRPSGPVL